MNPFCRKNFIHGLIVTISSLLTLLFCCGLLTYLLSSGTDHKQFLINNNDVVLLGYFDIYWYNTFQVHKAEGGQCDECTLDVYSLIPERLIVSDRDYNLTSATLTASENGVILKPEYFIDGSRIKLNFSFFPSSGQDLLVSINVYNDLSLYEKFRKGEDPEPMETHLVNVTTFALNLFIVSTGYYFIGISPVMAPISFQFSLYVHQIYYSKDNYTPKCSVQDTSEYCSLSFPTTFTDDNTKLCVMVNSEGPDVVATSYYVSIEYYLYRRLWTVCSILLLSCVCVTLIFTLTFSVCWCVCCVRRKYTVQGVSHDSYYYSI